MNTPNKLTIARMIIVPFLVIFLLTGWGGEANRYISSDSVCGRKRYRLV